MNTYTRALLPAVILCFAFAFSGCGSGSEGYGASARCKDGSYIYATSGYSPGGLCSDNGGLDTFFSANLNNAADPYPYVSKLSVFAAPAMDGTWSGTYRWSRDGIVNTGKASFTVAGGSVDGGTLWDDTAPSTEIPISKDALNTTGVSGNTALVIGSKIVAEYTVKKVLASEITSTGAIVGRPERNNWPNGTLQVVLQKQ